MGTAGTDGRRGARRGGLRVYDADTPINPAVEVLEGSVDASFRLRLADLAASRISMDRPADSDDSHSECQAPNSVANSVGWSSLRPDTKRKLLWDNASRFYWQS
jgi:hypothetical protein